MTGFLDGADLAHTEDGRFELSLGVERQRGNWLPMGPSTDTLMVRELFFDPEEAVPSVVEIERTDGSAGTTALTVEAVVTGLAKAGAGVEGILGRFGQWTVRSAERPNRLWTMAELLGEGEILRVGGSPAIDYYLGYWVLEPDQALLIDVAPRPNDRWSFQLMNYWQENLNLPWSGSHLNGATARTEEGSFARLVVATENPGVANWIDTAAHGHGVMLFRWFGPAAERPVPVTRVVGLNDVEPEPGGIEAAKVRRRKVAPGYKVSRIG